MQKYPWILFFYLFALYTSVIKAEIEESTEVDSEADAGSSDDFLIGK